MGTNAARLELRGITKSFPGVNALSDVDLIVQPGEIHALVGENGAGKSTLMKILTGVYSADAGKILVDGKEISVHGPDHARKLGIEMIYQEPMLVPHLSIAANIFLGREPVRDSRIGVLNHAEILAQSQQLLEKSNLSLNVGTPARRLGLAQCRLVEIVRALAGQARILILDEVTASLSPSQVAELFERLRHVAKQGVSVLFVSHRLDEIKEIADHATVLRDGHKVASVNVSDTTVNDLVRMMIGREIGPGLQSRSACRGPECLRVEHLNRAGVLTDISFAVSRGEIVGIAGLVGSGRTELVRTLFGADRKTSGRIFLDGKEVTINNPSDAVLHGIGLLTEDRRASGLSMLQTVTENITLASLAKFIRGRVYIDRRAENTVAQHYVEALRIKTPRLSQPVRLLSGGNQQKVVLAKWLCTDAKVLIFDEPTRGIDVGAKAEIHQLMAELRDAGKAIIMISSELPEILLMSDRILVMGGGRVVGELNRDQASEERIMLLASTSAKR